MAPRDFWLFPKNKLTMKETRFDMIPEIEAATKEILLAHSFTVFFVLIYDG
jgi:hypothetical protein